jgi:diguanylate cyclase (GGDEF)-like protein
VGALRARVREYLLEPTTEADRTTPELLLTERLIFGGGFLLTAVLCALLLPAGHGFSWLAPLALVLLALSMRFNVQRTGNSWTSCEQAAFVLVAFTLPLNLLPLAMFACGLITQPRRPRPVLTVIVTGCNSWAGVAAALLLSALAPGPASWHHWPGYVIAFGSQILVAVLIFAARERIKGRRMPLEDGISAVSIDASLTPIGLAAAVELHAAPGASVTLMLGATALLALTHHEHRQRIVQTERALRDPLTGLANRALFDEAGAACESRCQRNAQQAALLLVDLDDFKRVNDTLGHRAGDEVLCAFAERMRDTTRAVDLPARVGGDEFALILAEPIDITAARHVAEDLRVRLSAPIELSNGQLIQVHASIGLALFGAATPLEAAAAQADAALYEEKLVSQAQRGGKARSMIVHTSAPAPNVP